MKSGNCSICGKEIWIKKRANSKQVKCEDCKCKNKKNPNPCKYCGQLPCKKPDICKRHKMFPILAEYFGFDESKVGTIEIYEEFNKVKNLLIEDY